MKNFKIMRYLKKLLPIIVILCVVATYGIYVKLNDSNTYVASEVIHYNDPAAEQGLTPTGSKLDVNEIKSSAILSKVVDRMGLTGIYSVDSLISRISITPLPDEDKLAQKEAKLEEGEEYVYEPSTYIVSFTATNDEGSVFARTILDETLDVYFAEYSQKYVNVAPAKNIIDNTESANYDYIEMVELIDVGIDETLTTLYQRMDQNPYYRSTKTGASFSDLADDFNYLRSVKLSSMFSKIYKYQITKNKTLLVSDYKTRIDNNVILNAKEESIVKDTVAVIDAYVEKMRESGNTNITYEYILDNLHDGNLVDGNGNPLFAGDQTVTYDELIFSWRDHKETKEYSVIDSAYCNYLINTFTACTGACDPEHRECATSNKTCTEIHNENYQQLKTELDEEINTLISDLTELYNLTMSTNEEYNQYLGASYISVLSSASVKPSINVILYTLIAFFFLIVLCCGGAIVLARVADIVNYVFYTDHLTNLYNRAYFDKYLKSMDKKLLDDGTVYCIIEISNLAAINAEFSRQVGDEVIKTFTSYLKEAFGKTNAEYIYNGNGSFVVLAQDADYITAEDILRLFRIRLDERDVFEDFAIEYKIGIAESFKENKTARKLLSEAIKSKKDFVAEIIEK
ncbi:MAG: diguanylate cyclase [Clostridia bacterium]|nr:diguanylate cyclase [Clostridia bacterium]